jgi:hypothetical protein
MIDRAFVEQFFNRRGCPPPGLIEAVDKFVRHELKISRFQRRMQWDRAEMWECPLDAKGNNIEPDPPRTPMAECRARRMIKLLVSLQGPFVTAETSTLKPRNDLSDRDCAMARDEAATADAVGMAQRIAERFGLHYLDAAELRAWKIDETTLEDHAWSHLEDDEPDGFNLLFYEF